MPNDTCDGTSRFDTGLVTSSGAPTTSDAAGNILPVSGGAPLDPNSLQTATQHFDGGSVSDFLSGICNLM